MCGERERERTTGAMPPLGMQLGGGKGWLLILKSYFTYSLEWGKYDMGFNVAFLFYPCLKAEWEPNSMEALNKTL